MRHWAASIMLKRCAFSLLLVACSSPPKTATSAEAMTLPIAAPITEENWHDHPQVVEVRVVVAAVDAGIASGWSKQQSGHLCDGIDAESALTRDAQ